MLEGSVPEFVTPLISQPSPQPATSAPTHNGFTLAVRGVRFCGSGMRVAPPQKASPSAARTLTHHSVRTPAAKPAPQRRKSTGARKGGASALITTPIPTPLPPDVTSRLKASLGQDRPRFCDRLNAMLKSGVNNIECDDDKDPYAFVESSSVTEIHQLQRPLQQTIRNNGIVNTNGHSRKSPATNALSVVKPKRRKTNNTTDSIIPTVIQPGKSIILTPNSTAAVVIGKQQTFLQVQQQQLFLKQNFVKMQQAANNIARPQNLLKQAVTRQEITSTSSISASNSHATSILRPVKFAELVNNRRLSSDDQQQVKKVINNITSKNNILTKIPATLPSSNLAPPLAPLKSVISEDEKTTMNQLQAKIARNRVIGKHHRNNKVLTTSSHSQSIIANPSNRISSQQLSKLKERSLLEEQLLLGIKQEKSSSPSSLMKQPQQMKTVTKHFTYPTKSAGSVVTYKKLVAPSPPLQAIVNTSGVSFKDSRLLAAKKKAAVKQELDPHKTQLQKLKNIRSEDEEFRKTLFDHGFGEDVLPEKEFSPFQHHWHFQEAEVKGDDNSRETRLNNMKAAFRRRYVQLQKAVQSQSTSNGDNLKSSSSAMLALVNAARTQPNRTAALLETAVTPLGSSAAIKTRHRLRRRRILVRQSICCMSECERKSLPLARHCADHIMYNVDQLLFEHCTAKFADNTQCCKSVFDIQHELPLCQEHAKKRDNYNKMTAETRPKKARKRSKPAAMTRPSKRGKKRRRNNSPAAISEPTLIKHEPMMIMPSPGHSAHMHSPPDIVEAQGVVPMYMTADDSLSQPPHHSSLAEQHVLNWRRVPGSDSDSDMAGLLRQVEAHAMSGSGLGLVEEEDLPLEGAEEELATLPLEGAEELAHQDSRLLEEHDDLASVLSQIPPDTLNELFNGEKTGVYEPTREETEELERALAAVDKDVRSLEKMQKMGGSTTSVLPAELVESILGGHLGVHLDDTSVSSLGAGLAQPLSRHHGMVKEEVVVGGCSQLLGNTSHLMGIHNSPYQVHQGADMHLLSGGPDSMIQLDAAVFPPEAMLVPNLGHSTHQTLGTTFLLPQQTSQFQATDLLHQSLLHQSLGDSQQQLMLTPATSVFGGGAAPPPTPNSAHQPAVANTPPFHHQNGFLSNLGGQFDAKFGLPSPAAQFSSCPLTSSMGTQTQHADS